MSRLLWKKLYNCPHCGSPNQAMSQVMQDGIELGLLEPVEGDLSLKTESVPITFGRQLHTGDDIMVFYISTDYCYDCGSQYTCKLALTTDKVVNPSQNKIVIPKNQPPSLDELFGPRSGN